MAKKAAKPKSTESKSTAKKDEFYTQLSDIERELNYYKSHFKDKVVYCNCDDPEVVVLFTSFRIIFEKFGLKSLIATCYKNQDMDLFSEIHLNKQSIWIMTVIRTTTNSRPKRNWSKAFKR
ncbi:MAG: hypothetical protein IPJ82_02055 [Lewinellaceae bacterium]|nr:hypothetical protein [Lewinellaceae bacterium]